MDAEKSSLNASSLVDLKAELQKKYDSFKALKIKQNANQLSRHTLLKNKGETSKEKKIKLVTAQPKESDNEDINLKKSRLALEAKAKLYEKIMSSSVVLDEEQKDNYLVDFQQKILQNPTETAKTDVNDIKTTPSSYPSTVDHFATNLKPKATIDPEKPSSESQEKSEEPIHYQNVQYNEIRDHGTGYFAFSEKESERKEQMAELNSLRQETEEQRSRNQRLQKKRKALLQARLTKICERKNIDVSVVKAYTEESEASEDLEPVKEDTIDLSKIPLPDMNREANTAEEQAAEKEPKVRPWDMGKDNLQYYISQKKIKTQDQWIEEKRQERPNEFAPPTFYR